MWIRVRHLVIFLTVLGVAAFVAAAATNPPPSASAPVTVASAAEHDTVLAPDPFLGRSEIASGTETHLACMCIYGVNCCGDYPYYPYRCSTQPVDKDGNPTGPPKCVCSAGYQCRRPH